VLPPTAAAAKASMVVPHANSLQAHLVAAAASSSVAAFSANQSVSQSGSQSAARASAAGTLEALRQRTVDQAQHRAEAKRQGIAAAQALLQQQAEEAEARSLPMKRARPDDESSLEEGEDRVEAQAPAPALLPGAMVAASTGSTAVASRVAAVVAASESEAVSAPEAAGRARTLQLLIESFTQGCKLDQQAVAQAEAEAKAEASGGANGGRLAFGLYALSGAPAAASGSAPSLSRIQQLADKELLEASLGSTAIRHLCIQIEQAVFRLAGENLTAASPYYEKAKNLIFALSGSANTSLRRRILSGDLAAFALASLPSHMVASDEVLAERERIRSHYLMASADSRQWLPASFRCEACGCMDTEKSELSTERDIRKTEVWGSSGNEESRAFIRCRKCGSEWVMRGV
jgi:hypothetical protein